jgi:1-acyl-sn-glycerol-3-phosphate acyltransferase
VIRILLYLTGAIPKSKGMTDVKTVRNIFRIKRQKGIIGIFPEGMSTWDGHSNPTFYATAKLVKTLRLPVFIPIIKGGYLSLPRWSTKRRKGSIIIDYGRSLSAHEIEHMSVPEIDAALNDLIVYDEWEHQHELPIEFRIRRRAEHIELALFVCPECEQIGSLRSRLHRLTCMSCGYTVIMNTYGFFEAQNDKLHFDNIRRWNLWQLGFMTRHLLRAQVLRSREPVLSDGPLWVWSGCGTGAMKRTMYGALSVFTDRLEFHGVNSRRLAFPLDEIQGVNVQLGEVMEFYFNDILYAFRFKHIWISGYKWMVAINILRGRDVFRTNLVD